KGPRRGPPGAARRTERRETVARGPGLATWATSFESVRISCRQTSCRAGQTEEIRTSEGELESPRGGEDPAPDLEACDDPPVPGTGGGSPSADGRDPSLHRGLPYPVHLD